jgi:hypothetical protein
LIGVAVTGGFDRVVVSDFIGSFVVSRWSLIDVRDKECVPELSDNLCL